MAARVSLVSRHFKGAFVCNSTLILIFLCLFASSVSVNGQSPTKNQAPANLNNQKSRISPAPQPKTTGANAKARVLFDEGMKQTEAGQHSEAAESFRQAVTLDPQYADAYSALGREYFKMRQWQKAIDNLRQATALHAKQREADHAVNPSASASELPSDSTSKSIAKREEPHPANPASSRRQEPKLQQATNLNSGVKSLPAGSTLSEQPDRVKEKNTPTKTTSPSSGSKPVATKNSNPVVLKTVPPTSTPAASTEHQKESNTAANAISRSGEIKPPQTTNLNAALLKPLPAAPTDQRKETNAAANPTAHRETKLPLATNTSAALVKMVPAPRPPGAPTAQTRHSNTVSKASSTGADIKTPPAISANAAGVKPLNSKSETAKEHEQADTAAKAARVDANSVQLTISSGTGEKPPPVDSALTQQSKVKSDEANAGEKEEVEGARISMNVTPPSAPLENKSITPTELPSADVPATQIYRVGPNDVLDIHLSDSHSPLSTLFTVTPSGLLEHPMLPKPLLVTGSTPDEIGAKIETELHKLGSTENPQVIVGVRDYASHAILISGLVKDPGTRFLRREAIPLYVAVADAQPLPEAARVTVVRSEVKRIYEMDLAQAADMNFLVRPGDVITLNPNVTEFIYIGGEVKFPGEKTFRRGLTLMQAIIAAGGATSKSKAAEVGRDDGQGFLVGTRFDLQEIQSGKAADPMLHPGDRVMILR
jgi:protein involved in polysaccharide export with SLBB domain/tetratricopeptide (TPR) repeat protein